MRVVILGDGGHARVISGMLWGTCLQVRAVADDAAVTEDDRLILGMGDIRTRARLFETFGRERFMTLIHRSAVISEDSAIGAGVQVMAGVIVQSGARLRDGVLINTRASIDHGCDIGAFCHIAPGAVLCGDVTLGERCLIGAGSIIVEGVKLEPDTFIPAGSLVVGPDDIRRPQRVVRDRETKAPAGESA